VYVAPDAARSTISVFKYDITTGEEKLLGISTGAASFTGGGNTITVGNQKLTYKMASERPEAPVLAQLAIARPEQSEVDVKPLGFDTTADMLAQSTLEYSKSANEAAMQMYAPNLPVPWRKILTYSLKYDSAFLIAEGPARGTVTMSWSLKGRWLALLDGDATAGTVMSVLVPPR
jgi:hypothetical protein